MVPSVCGADASFLSYSRSKLRLFSSKAKDDVKINLSIDIDVKNYFKQVLFNKKFGYDA